VAVFLAACSNSPSAPSASPSTSNPTAPPITSPHTWTIDSVDASGATWTTSVAIAPLVSGHALKSYSALYGNPCAVDPTTDAIVPFQITTTGTATGNLTASGDQQLEIVNASLGVAPDGSDAPKDARGTQSGAGVAAGEALKAAEKSSSAATCSSLDPPGEKMTLGNDSLTNGQEAPQKGYFVLKHWAGSSNHGDTSWVPNIWIRVPSSGSRQSGHGWETTSVNGPAVVSLLDYTPIPTYSPFVGYGAKNIGYGWVFPIDGRSQPDCGRASSTAPSGSSMPSIRSLCEALPEQVVVQYLSTHPSITDGAARSLTGITSEDTMQSVFADLQHKGEIEKVPGTASAWRKTQPQ
jgi:hypothetical protein